MTKFLLGLALGYMLSDMIDELLGKDAPNKPSSADFTEEKSDPPITPEMHP